MFKIVFLFGVVKVGLFILLLPNTVHAAPKLPKQVEEIANTHLYRLNAIDLLYDKETDFEKAFNCRDVGSQVTGNRTDALCMSPKDNVILTLVIIKSDTGYPAYVLVCPAGFDSLDPFKITNLAHQSDPKNFQGADGTSYYMGRTNGWLRKFENIYLTADLGFSKANCWALNKR